MAAASLIPAWGAAGVINEPTLEVEDYNYGDHDGKDGDASHLDDTDAENDDLDSSHASSLHDDSPSRHDGPHSRSGINRGHRSASREGSRQGRSSSRGSGISEEEVMLLGDNPQDATLGSCVVTALFNKEEATPAFAAHSAEADADPTARRMRIDGPVIAGCIVVGDGQRAGSVRPLRFTGYPVVVHGSPNFSYIVAGQVRRYLS
jgi:hypothetical protein